MQHEEIERIFSILGIGAAGGILAPMPIYGDYLNAHGFLVLSYAEWFKTIGSFYILCLLTQMAGISIPKILSNIVNYLRKKR